LLRRFVPRNDNGSEKTDPNKIGLVFGEGILFSPTLFLEVGHDVTTDDGLGFRAKKGNGLVDTSLVVPQAPVSHLIGFPALEFVQPAVDFFIGIAEQGQGLPAMFFKGGHDLI
jgi:hypothetical protein